MNELFDILAAFALNGAPVSCENFGSGHINTTYLVSTDNNKKYILQKINTSVFKDADGLMSNIQAVTAHIAKKADDKRKVLQLIKTSAGRLYYTHTDGSVWRVCNYIDGSICLQLPETPSDFYESAVAFGTFQQQLIDFPAHTLVESIPNFHNTPDRYHIFREVLKKDPLGRAAKVKNEIDFALSREEEMSQIHSLLQSGSIPLRVTHNDTKLNNVMLDAQTRKALCVIDLDTVMPGSSLYDYGDSIRFGAASGAEDEKDLSKIEVRLDMFRAYTEGFLSACPGLTALEKELMPLGAKTMTLECGLRFLTDYIDGDNYFAIHREGHNLDRCRTQFKLVSDMESKWQQMNDIVKELCR